MSDMPDVIYVRNCNSINGKLPVSTEPSVVFSETKYTRTDLAQSMADALEGLYNAVTDIRGIDMNTYAETELTKARSALANYRKGE